MHVTVFAERSVLETALAAAEEIGAPGQLTGLSAPLDGATLGRLNDAWDQIKEALNKVFELGEQKARPVIERAWTRADEVIASAGSKAQEVRDALLARLREYLATFVDGMLQQLRPEIRVGQHTLILSQIQLSQKVVLTGSLKAAISEVCALTSGGEFEVVANYSTA